MFGSLPLWILLTHKVNPRPINQIKSRKTMAKFIKIDDQIINVNHIVTISKETYHNDKSYTKIVLTPNRDLNFITTDLTLEEVYKLIENCSKN